MPEHDPTVRGLTGILLIRAGVFATTLGVVSVLFLGGCGPQDADPSAEAAPGHSLDTIAEEYVKLGLALGSHDPDYVDAYLGPTEWREEEERAKRPLSEIQSRAAELIDLLGAEPPTDANEITHLRHRALRQNIGALAARAEMIGGKAFSFDTESRVLFDAVAPVKSEREFQTILDDLAHLIPGQGPLNDRYQAFREQFEIPADRVDAVLQAAIGECRARAARFISLPKEESFELEYVTDKPWGAYNWYKGNYHSLIQVNTGRPIYIDDAVGLACHEGYPGHHVKQILRERNLLHERGRVEFSLFPLFSPDQLISEGSAVYGVRLAFPDDERVTFERETLFPIADLDPALADEYRQVQDLVEELNYARNEAARRLLSGEVDRQRTVEWLERYMLLAPVEAERRVRFVEKYRSYVINYNYGKDLVRQYVEARGGANASAQRKWQVFEQLLASPSVIHPPSSEISGR